MSTAKVTARLAKLGHPEVELVRGEGYHYFVFDDGTHFETESLMVMRFRNRPFEDWVADGVDFANRMKARFAPEPEVGDLLPVTDENIALARDIMGKVSVDADSRLGKGHRRILTPYRLADGRWYVRHLNQYHRRFITNIKVNLIRSDGFVYYSAVLGPVINSSRIT